MNKKFPAIYCSIYSVLQEVAKDCGYALAVHGSMARDFDIIAIPWVENPAKPHELFEKMKSRIHFYWSNDKKHDIPTIKPHGRVAYNILLDGGYFLDLSIMTPAAPSRLAELVGDDVY